MKRFFDYCRKTWEMLNRSIYTGKRLEENLKALSFAGALFAAVGLALAVYDFGVGKIVMGVAATATCLFGAACTFCAAVLKRRELAIIMPTVFCMGAFTVYALTGAGEGTLILWAFTLPIGICYFVSVKYGILLSIYYTVLFVALFFTPLGNAIKPLYPESFVARFPLLYASTAILTAAAMVQYHRGILLENEYAERLHDEVEKQTALAVEQSRVATERAQKLQMLSDEMVQTLARTIDAKDRYTNGHSFRVAEYAAALAARLGWSEAEIRELSREALLHDIGKIGVPDAVLNKPGQLTEAEFRKIQSHTAVGKTILEGMEDMTAAAEVASYHHERYDGTGYPEGLKGEEIPAHARVISIADAFDAMRSDRVYRKGLGGDVIRAELEKGSGTQFDPVFLSAFVGMLDAGAL